MMDKQPTRRRVIQGAGIIGVTGIVGSSAVSAQQSPTDGGTATTQGGGTALRVTHASPDAPAVNVRLDDQTVIEGLSFGTVSDYQTVEPGSYQLQVVAAQQGALGGLLSGLFGSQDGQSVLYDQEITVEQGTTYTAVAFGQASQGPAQTPTGSPAGTPTPDGGTTPAGTPGGATPMAQELQMGGGGQGGGPLVEGLAFGESASATVPAGDYRLLIRPTEGGGMPTTPSGGGTPTPPSGGATPAQPDAETGTPEEPGAFRVEILEDDLSSPPEGQSRVRVFHAVPNLDQVTIVAAPQGGGQGPPQSPGQGQGDGQGPPQSPGQGQGQGGGPPQNPGQGQGPPISADVTLEAGTVYSGFALGYAPTEEGTPTPEGTPGTPTEGTPAGGDRPEFELVVAETATDGQRVQGGGTN
jgi:hypothetical protein